MQASVTLRIRGFAAKHRESSEVSRISSKFYNEQNVRYMTYTAPYRRAQFLLLFAAKK
jgi:hypothetical protein